MTTVPVHCLYSLYSLKHCINIVLNATSYETMYDSIALQTNKQTLEVDKGKSGGLGRVYGRFGAVRGSPMDTVEVGRDNIVIA